MHTHTHNASSKLRNKNQLALTLHVSLFFPLSLRPNQFFMILFSSSILFRAYAISHKARRKKNTNNRSKRIHNDRNYLGRTYSNFHVFTFEPIPQLNDVHANMMFIQCGFVIYVYFMTRPRYLFLFALFPSFETALALFASMAHSYSLSLSHSFIFSLFYCLFFLLCFVFSCLSSIYCRDFVPSTRHSIW